MKKLTILILLFFTLGSASAWNPFKAQTYQECILENMKGVKSDDAASQIQVACIMKTSKGSSGDSKTCKDRNLTTEEKENVKATASINHINYIEVKIYNGNKNISIKQGNASIRAKNINPPQMYKLYFKYPIEPLSSGTVDASLMTKPSESWDWFLSDLMTCTY
jgi:hypothetical protein